VSNQDAEKRISYSRQTVGVAWQAISSHIGGGRLIDLQGQGDDIAKFLDTTVSIDALYGVKNGAYKGLAHRSQKSWPGRPFCTHTVRWNLKSGNRTERHKLIAAYEEQDAIGPALHMHAYFDQTSSLTDLICVAAVPTRQLVRLMIEHEDCFTARRVYDGNTLGFVTWDCMLEHGLEVTVCNRHGRLLEPDGWPDTWQNNPKSRLVKTAAVDAFMEEFGF
jgi:hypothetical protein